MNISEQTKHEIEQLFKENSFNCRSISISTKEKDEEDTSEICICVGVPEKKPREQLTAREIVPEEIEINGQKFKTDVKEIQEIKAMGCYASSTDPNILKLRGDPQLLTPLKGGQEIVKFPTGWTDNGGGSYSFSVGTLGFFAIDNIDNRLVGVTNTHVVVDKLLFTGDRDIAEEASDPFNTISQKTWVVDGQNYPSAARCRDESVGDIVIETAHHIKRYHPFKSSATNYVDAALIMMNPNHVDETESFKIHHPDSETESTAHMPFASTAEIDSLLDSPKPNLFSTGRTTGPKGWGADASCTMETIGLSVNINVDFNGTSIPFGDVIQYQHSDASSNVIDGGDSGSVLVADFSGTLKIVGIAFAGSSDTTTAFACRIDRVANALNIREWDSGYTFDATVPSPSIVTEPIENASADQLTVSPDTKTYYQIGTTIDPSSLDILASNDPPELWTPAEITTAKWFDFSDSATISTDGSGNVTQVNDKSGNTRHWTAPTVGEQPSFVSASQNGLDTILCDGTGERLSGTAISVKTIAMVCWWTDGTGDYRNILAPRFDYHGATAASGKMIDTSFTQGAFDLGSGFKDGSALDHDLFLRYTSPTVHVFRHSTAWNVSGTGYQTPSTEGRTFNGQYGEIVALTSEATNETVQKLEGYLAHKWGLEVNLPANHPYKTEAPKLRVGITAISPTSGSVAGNTNVTINGWGFSDFGSGDSVTIGGSAATNVVIVSDTELTCDTPSGTAGIVDVGITINAKSDILKDGFEYINVIDYAELDPALTGGNLTIRADNITVANLSGNNFLSQTSLADSAKSSGKHYFEIEVIAGSFSTAAGIAEAAFAYGSQWVGNTSGSYALWESGLWNNGSNADNSKTVSTGDVVMIAVDLDAGKLWFGKNGTWFDSGDPVAGTGEQFSGLSGSKRPAITPWGTNRESTMLSDPADHTYSAPSGFAAGWTA